MRYTALILLSDRIMSLIRYTGMTALVAGFGCSSEQALVRSGLEVTTDKSSYVISGERVYAQVTIRNTASSARTLAGCGGAPTPLVEIESAGEWREHHSVACVLHPNATSADGPLEPLTLMPGEQISAYVAITSAGRFRVRAPLFVDARRMQFSRETSAVFDAHF